MKIEILDNHIGIFYQAFDKEFCNNFIEYFKILEDLKYVHQRNNYKTKDMTVDIIGEKYYDSSFPLNANLGNFLKKMFDNCYIHYRNKYPILNELHSHSIRNVLLQKTKPGEGYHKWHCENDHTAGKDRVCAFMLYLNDVEEGGGTGFDNLSEYGEPIQVQAKKGRMVVFTNVNDDGTLNLKSRHAGLPVIKGEKWAFNLWLRESE